MKFLAKQYLVNILGCHTNWTSHDLIVNEKVRFEFLQQLCDLRIDRLVRVEELKLVFGDLVHKAHTIVDLQRGSELFEVSNDEFVLVLDRVKERVRVDEALDFRVDFGQFFRVAFVHQKIDLMFISVDLEDPL